QALKAQITALTNARAQESDRLQQALTASEQKAQALAKQIAALTETQKTKSDESGSLQQQLAASQKEAQ
ncbi:hypothetical protein, partial [Franconibacter pulveris]